MMKKLGGTNLIKVIQKQENNDKGRKNILNLGVYDRWPTAIQIFDCLTTNGFP